MNKFKYIWIILSFIFLSCEQEDVGNCFESTGKIIKEKRELFTFSSIEINDHIEVNLHHSDVYYVEVTAGENLINLVRTKVKDQVLVIENENRCNWMRSYTAKNVVDVYCPVVYELTYYGSAKVQCIDTIKQEEFILNMWESSGSVDILFKGDYIELKSHTGPGDIHFSGECRELISYMNGNGNFNSLNAQCEKAVVINQNSGNLKVRVDSFMRAEIKDNGNIEYLGNPTIDLEDLGKGELIKLSSN